MQKTPTFSPHTFELKAWIPPPTNIPPPNIIPPVHPPPQDEYVVEAFELVTLFCELLSTRAQLVIEARGCPADMKEGL